MQRVTLTLADDIEAQTLDRLVARFTEELAVGSDECVFYLSQPGGKQPERIVEMETAETLQRFIDFVTPHLAAAMV
ncbi:MAG: hypothetical protein RIA71_04455 [Oceanicaulis sp.]|jgi:hypothetical protein